MRQTKNKFKFSKHWYLSKQNDKKEVSEIIESQKKEGEEIIEKVI